MWILVAATDFGRKSATAAAITTTSAVSARLEHGLLHLGCRLDPLDPDPLMRRLSGRRDEDHLRAAAGGGVGHRMALLAR